MKFNRFDEYFSGLRRWEPIPNRRGVARGQFGKCSTWFSDIWRLWQGNEICFAQTLKRCTSHPPCSSCFPYDESNLWWTYICMTEAGGGLQRLFKFYWKFFHFVRDGRPLWWIRLMINILCFPSQLRTGNMENTDADKLNGNEGNRLNGDVSQDIKHQKAYQPECLSSLCLGDCQFVASLS